MKTKLNPEGRPNRHAAKPNESLPARHFLKVGKSVKAACMWWDQINIFKRLTVLEREQKAMADEIQTLKATLDTVVAELPVIQTGIGTIQATLAALQNSTTSTLSPDDQAALDAAVVDANAIASSVNTIGQSLAPPPPTTTATPVTTAAPTTTVAPGP